MVMFWLFLPSWCLYFWWVPAGAMWLSFRMTSIHIHLTQRKDSLLEVCSLLMPILCYHRTHLLVAKKTRVIYFLVSSQAALENKTFSFHHPTPWVCALKGVPLKVEQVRAQAEGWWAPDNRRSPDTVKMRLLQELNLTKVNFSLVPSFKSHKWLNRLVMTSKPVFQQHTISNRCLKRAPKIS